MRRKTYFLLVCLCVFSNYIQSQNTFIPDDNFEQFLIDSGFDSGALDNFVPTANINTVTNLQIDSKNIADLTGIEDFNALSILNCSDNNLSSLSISTNINLTQLYCNSNVITDLNVTSLPDLKIFWCDNNLLSKLDITKNPNLISLVCNTNYLNYLDTSENEKLTVLSCSNNGLLDLNVTENKNLNSLLVNGNLLTNIDLSENNILTILDCSFNALKTLDISITKKLRTIDCSNNQIEQLDASEHPDLVELNCSYNDLCSLNIKNGNNNNLNALDFSVNSNLSCVVVDNPGNKYSYWEPSSFTDYVNSTAECHFNVPVDSLNNFVGISYVLPEITNGSYFTESNGNGLSLKPNEVINTTQNIFIFNNTACHNNESFFNVTIINDAFYIPKYFTPNNDGNHDFWQVYDTLNLVESIYVYNRHGKLLKAFNTNSIGWNGIYNGQLLPPSDYWYVITLNTKETLKGHFTLKR
ncbi:T9SS type B sorting domain-containing protein [Algibacter sp. L4_22]|uniref:T9SS type B sorting domain-containing protein n=1 Tax=Algibacter sp. L4_22 TaxID=2942477 RepID=UPI00201B8183|nr:T9SS type B sorting domain-containing protein [Algibacter sp. L4_22]MCL5127202.1 T9SS type B sorting domain-containing protein [Algibacter sp. L4_22]